MFPTTITSKFTKFSRVVALAFVVSVALVTILGKGGGGAAPVDPPDTTAPVITITGNNPERVQLRSTYTDAGATAMDNVDGDVTADITTTSDVDTDVLGFYTVTYQVSDAAGNSASATRDVEVFNDLPQSLNQAAYNGTSYVYDFDSIGNIGITGAPDDTDRSRWAMLHDGMTYRLYFMRVGFDDTLYQFAFNPMSATYEYGGGAAIPMLAVTGFPPEADPSSFAMLHDGNYFRLYMKDSMDPTIMYQGAYNLATQAYEYSYESIPILSITGFPMDTDHSRWAMLHDGDFYRYYAFKEGSVTNFYQAAFNLDTEDYEYNFESIPELTVEMMPADSDTSSHAMLHDVGGVVVPNVPRFRFYYQTQIP